MQLSYLKHLLLDILGNYRQEKPRIKLATAKEDIIMQYLPVDEALLRDLMPYATRKNVANFLEPLNLAMEKYQINTKLRIAAFLAQIAHESCSLHYVRELASGHAYDNRKDLGNTDPVAIELAGQYGSTTSGVFYRGAGLIQCTGYANYKQLEEALGYPVTTRPTLLCEPELAALSAGWFWNTHNCNALADVDQFSKITRVINGGYNGAEQRLDLYRHNVRVLERWERTNLPQT